MSFSPPLHLLHRIPDLSHSRLLHRPDHQDLKIEQKRVQNKMASRRAKEKKAREERHLMATVSSLKTDLENYKKANEIFEWKLYYGYNRDLYPNWKERSPYGDPANFFVTINHLKVLLEMETPMSNQLEHRKLLRKVNDLKKIILSRERPQGMSRGTFGSKRTRANRDLPMAELQLEHWELEFQKKTEVRLRGVLCNRAKTLNEYLRVINGAQLVEEKIAD